MRDLPLRFNHGLGDCVHFAHMLQLAKQDGYAPRVHYEQNKQAVWDAAGIPYCADSSVPYHDFKYLTDFNRPHPSPDYSAAKVAGCFCDPLPPLGPIADVWERLCAVDLSQSLYTTITPDDAAAAAKFCDGLPRPIILLHTHGTNWQAAKNLSNETTLDLYHRLLDGMPGSLVLLDWDNRVPLLASSRIRHIKQDWGHLTINQLAALYREISHPSPRPLAAECPPASPLPLAGEVGLSGPGEGLAPGGLLIGVDSGPYHLTAMTDLPAIGIFTGHYPSCVTLARSRSAVMTRDAASYQPVNQARRSRWSILEYPTAQPPAAAIATHALRMLAGPRYLTDPARIGRDVMLQQWVRDWLRQRTNLSPRADRDQTMDWLLQECTRRFASPRRTDCQSVHVPTDQPADGLAIRPTPTIVETGCCRSREDWSAGYSTYLLGCYLDGLGCGHLNTVDLAPDRLATARDLCQPWSSRITYHASDSVAWLAGSPDPIDVLYLDSLDADSPGHAEHCLAEVKAAESRLHAASILAIDDTVWSGGWKGKGAAAIPYLLANGWRIAASGYQVMLVRDPIV